MRFIDSYLSKNPHGSSTLKVQQAKSGLRLGIGMGLFLIAGMLLGTGMERVVWSAHPPHHVVWPEPIGWLAISVAAVILFSTVGVWWQLIAGCMLLGFFKSLIVLLTGHDLFAPHGVFPRVVAAELVIFTLASVALMVRLWEKQLTIVDRAAVTVYLFSLISSRFELSGVDASLVVAMGALLVAWLASLVKGGDVQDAA